MPRRELLVPTGVYLEGCSLRPSSPPRGLLGMALGLMGTAFPTGKECDLNRQCGVINPETKKICTRLLTCKVTPVSAHSEGGQSRHRPWAGRGAEMFSETQRQGWGEAHPRQREGRLPTVGPGWGQQAGVASRTPSQRRVLPCGEVKQRHTPTPTNTLTPPLSPLAQARAHRCPHPCSAHTPLPTPPSCCILDPLGAPAPGGPGPG